MCQIEIENHFVECRLKRWCVQSLFCHIKSWKSMPKCMATSQSVKRRDRSAWIFVLCCCIIYRINCMSVRFFFLSSNFWKFEWSVNKSVRRNNIHQLCAPSFLTRKSHVKNPIKPERMSMETFGIQRVKLKDTT